MKRSPMPRRKKQLRSSRPSAVSRDTADGRTGHERDLIRSAVFERDRVCRLLLTPSILSSFGPCGGVPLTPHHLRKAGQGGTYSMSNLLTLCAHHNDQIEVMPRLDMEAAGLVIPRSSDLAVATVRAWASVVYFICGGAW